MIDPLVYGDCTSPTKIIDTINSCVRALNTAESANTANNSDYAAALRVLAEWKHPDNRDLNLSFPAFCEERLNSSTNCA